MQFIKSPTHKSNIHGKMKAVTHIVLHASGRSKWATDEQELSYLRSEHSSRFCYHDYLMGNGDWHELAALDDWLWHVGDVKWQGVFSNWNDNSYGVALAGENLPSSLYPPVQYNNLIKGLAVRCAQLKLDSSKVIGHKELSAYRGKSDPAAFDMDKFRADLGYELGKSSAAESPQDSLNKAKRDTIVIERKEGLEVVYRGDFLVTDFPKTGKIHVREI